MMRCDDYIDRLYTVEELKQEYLRGRKDAIRELLFEKSEKDKEREEIERLNGRL